MTEWCPEDTHKVDGAPCYNGGETWCHKGTCRTHQSQCRYLWGDIPIGNQGNEATYSQNIKGAFIYFTLVMCGTMVLIVTQFESGPYCVFKQEK